MVMSFTGVYRVVVIDCYDSTEGDLLCFTITGIINNNIIILSLFFLIMAVLCLIF